MDESLANETHPLWGRKLGEYDSSYGLDTVLDRTHLDLDLGSAVLARAQEGIRQICALVDERPRATPNTHTLARQIHISTLQSVMKLALSPRTLHLLDCPPLMRGCIRLMSAVKVSDEPSPFSYEYGYLSFRIITTVVSVCFLKRWNYLDDTIASIVADPTTGPLLTLSRNASRAIAEIIEKTKGGPDCDWVLGLEIGSPCGLLAPRADGSLLLNLLWTDRKYFLEAFVKTYPLGLPGVMFLLWRYWQLGSVLDTNYSKNPTTPAQSPLYDVLWRCCLVAPVDQQDALLNINGGLDETDNLWLKGPVDSEDCKTLLRSYCDRIAPTNSSWHPPPDMVVTGRCLRFAVSYACPGVEDLLPSMVGVTIRYVMDYLDIAENISQEPLKLEGLDGIGMILYHLSLLFDHLRRASPAIMLQFAKCLAERDLIDLTARLLLIEPSVKTTDPDPLSTSFGRLFAGTETFLKDITLVVPRQMLQSAFEDTFPDWVKFGDHLTWRREMAISKDQSKHFNTCLGMWIRIGRLYYRHAFANTETNLQYYVACSYARCPDRTTCQASDWIYGGWKRSHQEFCKGSLLKS